MDDETKYWAIYTRPGEEGATVARLSDVASDEDAISLAQSLYLTNLYKIVRQVGDIREIIYDRGE